MEHAKSTAKESLNMPTKLKRITANVSPKRYDDILRLKELYEKIMKTEITLSQFAGTLIGLSIPHVVEKLKEKESKKRR